MIITATFVGKDSCGFEHGYKYELSIRQSVIYPCMVCIQAVGMKNNYCEYSNIEKFLENWTDIKSERK